MDLPGRNGPSGANAQYRCGSNDAKPFRSSRRAKKGFRNIVRPRRSLSGRPGGVDRAPSLCLFCRYGHHLCPGNGPAGGGFQSIPIRAGAGDRGRGLAGGMHHPRCNPRTHPRGVQKRPDLSNLLMDDFFSREIGARQKSLRAVVKTAAELGLPAPGLYASLAYFDAYRSASLPANLIQAQRDYFGALPTNAKICPGNFSTRYGKRRREIGDAARKIVGTIALVIFGGGGDLTWRKLVPALYSLFLDRRLPERFKVLGVGRNRLTDDSYRLRLREGADKFSIRDKTDEKIWDDFVSHISYLQADPNEPQAFGAIAKELSAYDEKCGEKAARIYYLALPPAMIKPVAEGLAGARLNRDRQRARIVVEKPFGHDLGSARELNRLLASCFKIS